MRNSTTLHCHSQVGWVTRVTRPSLTQPMKRLFLWMTSLRFSEWLRRRFHATKMPVTVMSLEGGEFNLIIIIIIINPLTARVVGAPQMILQPVFSVFPCSPLPAGTCRIPGLSKFPDGVFPPLPLSALSSSPFHCDLQDGFGKTWWTGNMTIPL